MTLMELIKLFAEHGYTYDNRTNPKFVKNGMEVGAFGNETEIHLSFSYAINQTRAVVNLLVDNHDLKDGVIKALSLAEGFRASAEQYYASTHPHTGC